MRWVLSPAPTPPDDFEAWEIETARAVVRAFVAARGSFASLDFDDLVQECLLHWWQQRSRYAEEHGASRQTYMNRVLTNRLRDLRREEQAEKRRADYKPLSLDAPFGDDGDTLADFFRDAGSDPAAEAEHADLVDRLARIRGRLLPRQRAVFDAWASDIPKARIARGLDISRDTVHEDIRRIRQVCRDEGLEDFLR